MITLTTCGAWLQGGERGYVRNGKIRQANRPLMEANTQLQLQDAVRLSSVQQQSLRAAATKEAAIQGQQMYALSVQPAVSPRVQLLKETKHS